MSSISLAAATLSQDAIFYDLFHNSGPPSTFSAKATRFFRFSVPDEWYRRSRPRSTSSMSYEPSDSTIKASQDTETSEEDGDGTAKQANTSALSDISPSSKTKSADWRQSLSQGRLSSVFEGWLRPSTPTSPRTAKTSTLERMSVSEPKLMERANGDVGSDASSVDAAEVDLDTDDFAQMLVRARYSCDGTFLKRR
jgi:diaphanous 1